VPREDADLDPRGRPVPPMPDPEEEVGPPRAAEADVTEAPESDDEEITSQPKKQAQGGEDGGKESKGVLESTKASASVHGKRKAEDGGDGAKEAQKKDDEQKEGEADEEGGEEGGGRVGVRAKSPQSRHPPASRLDQQTVSQSSPRPQMPSPAPSAHLLEGVPRHPLPSPLGYRLLLRGHPPLLFPQSLAERQRLALRSAFPSLSSVFGATNGTKLQLFGSGAAGGSGGAEGELLVLEEEDQHLRQLPHCLLWTS